MNNSMLKGGPTSHIYFSQRLRLHYVDWGNDDAPPMLMVHGGRDHCRNWDWLAQELKSDYHIIAPDLRGHGDSQWLVGGAYSTIDYVYDIAQLVRQTALTMLSWLATRWAVRCRWRSPASTRRKSASWFPSRAWG